MLLGLTHQVKEAIGMMLGINLATVVLLQVLQVPVLLAQALQALVLRLQVQVARAVHLVPVVVYPRGF